MSQSMLVLRVTYSSWLHGCKSRIVCSSSRLEHALHRARNISGPNEKDSLDVTTITLIVDSEIEFDEIAVPDSGVVVAYVAHGIAANVHGWATVKGPGGR